MDPRIRPAAPRQYEEFDPEMSWKSEEGAEILLLNLPGFKKEQLRVQLTPSRVLKISGERLLGGNRWQHFMKEARVPQGCDAKEITAKFEGGVLCVRQPKLITPANPQEKDGPKNEVPKPQLTQPQHQPMPAPAPAFAPAPAPAPAFAPAPAPALAPAPAPEKKEVVASKTREEAKELERGESRRAEPKTDDRNKCEEESREKEESGRKTEVVERLRYGGGILKELKKPENFKILAVIVVAAIAMALHMAYVNKVCGRYTAKDL